MILLALGLAAGPVFAAEAPAAAVPAAAPVSPAFLSTGSDSCPAATLTTPAPSAAALDLFGALSCCRPECSTNSGCDSKCGKGLGTCVQVNSCCKQCICSAT
ncbi:MAG: hypothetical protein ACJ76J_23920 [Thermoanaerobaculia bacterium]